VWFYSLISVLIVSVISLVGILTIIFKIKNLESYLLHFVSFSAGALFGDSFLHLLPDVVEKYGLDITTSLYILSGIIFFFIIEKIIHWRHCHVPDSEEHIHPFAITNLIGDAIHNFIDGLIIGASYLINIPTGVATTIAVILHEIPQEIGDFSVLLSGGFTKARALLMNLLTALTAFLGVIIALVLNNYVTSIDKFLIPFAAGSFIYIAGSDLIPELHKEVKVTKSLMQLVTFIFGILIMVVLLILE